MNDLKKIFENNTGSLINKWVHYFDIYDEYFQKYRGTEVVFLEIGIFQGGSLQMWKEYFGPKAKIYAIDINPNCKKFEDEQVKVFIGDQEDKKFLEEVKKNIPPIDILLDDGGHTMQQQINTFEILFSHVKYGGFFLCEDLHTSYWWQYGGGLRRKGTFIEYSKRLIDDMHAWHSKSRKFKVNQYTKSVRAIHFYDSIVVIEKQRISQPTEKQTGKMILPEFIAGKSTLFRISRFKNKLLPRK